MSETLALAIWFMLALVVADLLWSRSIPQRLYALGQRLAERCFPRNRTQGAEPEKNTDAKAFFLPGLTKPTLLFERRGDAMAYDLVEDVEHGWLIPPQRRQSSHTPPTNVANMHWCPPLSAEEVLVFHARGFMAVRPMHCVTMSDLIVPVLGGPLDGERIKIKAGRCDRCGVFYWSLTEDAERRWRAGIEVER